MQVIVFPNGSGGVGVIYPAPEYADRIEAVAAKDVPEGQPFVIMTAVDLPDRATRSDWTWAQFSERT